MWPDEKGEPDRRRNLLSTIYAVLAICRAERHGYRHFTDAWQALVRDEQPASLLVDNLITQIEVRAGADGPTITLNEGRCWSRGRRRTRSRRASSDCLR